jgi:hypothetical protein
MKVFLAGYFAAGRGMASANSIHRRITSKFTFPNVLESYYFESGAILAAIRAHRQRVFVDSGAFSAFTQGAKIDLYRYAKFVQRNVDLIETVAALDIIGEGCEAESYANLKKLEALLPGTSIVPTHHVRDHDQWLQRYLAEGYQHIALGGMVPESVPTLRLWLDRVWGRYLTNEDGTPKLKVHGFGLTNNELMFKYPWASVDSTSWLILSHYGSVILDFARLDGSIAAFKIDFSSRSPKRYDANSWHFTVLTPDQQKMVLARLSELEVTRVRDPELEAAFKAELGTELRLDNPDALALSYGARDLVNFSYYQRAGARGARSFINKQPVLFDDV